MSQTIKHICFDKDGTIIDVHAYWAHVIEKRTRKLLDHFNLPVKSLHDIALVMGVDLKKGRIIPAGPVGYKPREFVIQAAVDMIARLKVTVTNAQIAELFKEVDQFMQANEDYEIRMIKGSDKALKQIKEMGYKISFFSSDRSKNLIKNLKNLGIYDLVDAAVGGDDVKNSKPDPEGFRRACEQVGVALKQSIYIGDTIDDMLMAERTVPGSGVGLTTGLASRAELLKVTKNVFDSLSGVIGHLERARQVV